MTLYEYYKEFCARNDLKTELAAGDYLGIAPIAFGPLLRNAFKHEDDVRRLIDSIGGDFSRAFSEPKPEPVKEKKLPVTIPLRAPQNRLLEALHNAGPKGLSQVAVDGLLSDICDEDRRFIKERIIIDGWAVLDDDEEEPGGRFYSAAEVEHVQDKEAVA